MSFLSKSKNILGINARNLLYIAKYNSSANKQFADDKIFTKNFLQSRGIGVAKLYYVINSHEELNKFNFSSLPTNFVIKPNKGYGGSGILVIKNKKDNIFIQINGHPLNLYHIYKHCADIIDGKYAISGLQDKVVIEERLEQHEYFEELSSKGLPDVRINVFNLIPVIAMLRLPTKESEGKANLHLGGIGVGLDMGSGKGNFGVRYNQFIRKLPNGKRINEIKIPKWDEILFTAAKIQHVTGIGYLAVDLTLVKTEIKILEVNARAGLAIQIANKEPLKARLEKITDLKVIGPEQGVEIAKTLFSQKLIPDKNGKIKKEVIGLYEPILVLGDKNIKAIAKIDLYNKENFINKKIFNKADDSITDIIIKGHRLKLPFKTIDLKKENYDLIIAGQYLKDFLIDPNEQELKRKDSLRDLDEKIILNIDKKITDIEKQIKFLSYFRPLNLTEEKEIFFKNPIVSPSFIYKDLTIDCHAIKKDLHRIPKEAEHPLLPLYLKKAEELEIKLNIIEARNSQELGNYSEQLYGKINYYIYKDALEYIEKYHFKEDESKILNTKQIIKYLKEYLKEKKLSEWNIKILEDSPSDIQVNKKHSVFLKKDSKFTENRLKAIIVHEIETHIFRLENGRRQKYGLFEIGTPGYLETEEGLAIYNQENLNIPLGGKHIRFAMAAIAIYLGKKMTFCELFHYLKATFHLNDDLAWKICVKTKRGLNDTKIKTSFTKDIVYFTGYQKVKNFLENDTENKIKQLYRGKITIEDIKSLKDFEMKEAKLLPKRQ
ncbi:hypothetical protein A2335_04150 [Candidatus Peregrinibacteria bacterium RIFOXYB2_FULL_32_7]|nr:MAG: hypothetical protein A2335_04150 [Candidatus Peregrinibacteria bacterium RIFOXYB2_FULL_32_7]